MFSGLTPHQTCQYFSTFMEELSLQASKLNSGQSGLAMWRISFLWPQTTESTNWVKPKGKSSLSMPKWTRVFFRLHVLGQRGVPRKHGAFWPSPSTQMGAETHQELRRWPKPSHHLRRISWQCLSQPSHTIYLCLRNGHRKDKKMTTDHISNIMRLKVNFCGREKEGHFHCKNFLRALKWVPTWYT